VSLLKPLYRLERKNYQQFTAWPDSQMFSAGLGYPIILLVLSDDEGSSSRLSPAPDYSLTPLFNGLTLCRTTVRVKPTQLLSSAWSSREPMAGRNAGEDSLHNGQ